MARIEKIVVIILISAALTGIAVSYYHKRTQKQIRIIPAESTRSSEMAKEIIAERKMVNINTADRQTLTRLPGIGPALAQRIIDFRKESGNFISPAEIMKVKGIGPKKYEKIKDHIRVE